MNPLFTALNSPHAICHEIALRTTPMWQRLVEYYADLYTQVSIAERFTAHSAAKQDGNGVLMPAHEDTDYYFVGDLHGNFETLVSIICYACEKSTHPYLLLLGDAIDRGAEDFALLALIQDCLMGAHGDDFSLCYICGNHDFALDVKPNGFFFSAVSPADTANHLNTLSKSGHASQAHVLGKAAIELARISPYMGELVWQNNSLIFAHACTPHTDNQALLQEIFGKQTVPNIFEKLPDEILFPCRDDFMRGMLRTQMQHVAPQRGFLAATQGTDDMAAYFTLHHTLTGRRILGMLRGHDHVANGHRLTTLSNGFICTLNALGPGNTTIAAFNCINGISFIRLD